MTIQEQLKSKKEELDKMVAQYNGMQKNLNQLGQQILKVQGAIEQLEELSKDKKDK